MRHGKKFNHLGRTAPHRKAMLSNMASSLILEKRITTTVAKAKALRKYVEPLITRSKTDDTNSRRVVFSYLQNKESVSELFNEVSDKISSRPGGYTRILKTGNRLGDNADMCIIELVDYNEALLTEAKPTKAKTRRSRRGKGGSDDAAKPAKATEAKAPEAEAPVAEAEVVEEAPVIEEAEVVEEAPEVEAAAKETVEASTEESVEASTEESAEEESAEEPTKEATDDSSEPAEDSATEEEDKKE